MADIFKKIDTIGWIFAAFVVVVTASLAMVTVLTSWDRPVRDCAELAPAITNV
jgi:hypothetical protein